MYEAIALTCIVLFFQILMYKIGCKQGEKQHTSDLQKCVMCAEIRTNDKYL